MGMTVQAFPTRSEYSERSLVSRIAMVTLRSYKPYRIRCPNMSRAQDIVDGLALTH